LLADFRARGERQLSAGCLKSAPHCERREYSVVLNLIVGFREVVVARLSVGATNRVPTSSLKYFVGFRGKAPTAIYSFGAVPTDALHNAIAAQGRGCHFANLP
jgi:hypothetical protein